MPARSPSEFIRYSGVIVATGYDTPVAGFNQNVGVVCALPLSEISRLFATSRCVMPRSAARVRSTLMCSFG